MSTHEPDKSEPQSKPANITPRLLTRRMASRYLSVSLATLDSLRLRGELDVVKVPGRDGRPIRVPLYDLETLNRAIAKWTTNGGRQ